ncbi:MAG: methionyl-tRNA formyltransferase [Ruminococcus sp.]|nr:methionyl-tRNA formyltransferase [Ruminococcus sp.]
MKIVFMGTPDFAVPCLQALVDSKHEVVGVFTQPDKPKGRGYKMIPPPVKQTAQEYNIPVYQPLSLRKGDDALKSMEVLNILSPDLIVVVAYGQILPVEVLELPKYKCINIHASLLPAYRGAAPMQWCILNGETKTGVTSMLMAEGLDTGDMLIKEELEIGENETISSLHDRLSCLGAEVLIKTIDAIEDKTLSSEKQDDSLSSYAVRITKEMSALDFSEPARVLHNKIRGITGYTILEGKRLKVYSSLVVSDDIPEELENGAIVNTEKFIVKCGDGKGIQFLEIQPEGKKRMPTEAFLRGKKLKYGEKIG